MNDWPFRIPVGTGFFASVDEEDYDSIVRLTWHNKLRRNGQRYAYTNVPKTDNWRGGFTYTSMHKMISQPPDDFVVDHHDGDGLNNRRGNLRVCTQQNNSWNMKSRGGASAFKGVYFDDSGGSWRKPWRASICLNGKSKSLGRFADEIAAAHAYDAAATELFGEFAKLNLAPNYQERAAMEIGRK